MSRFTCYPIEVSCNSEGHPAKLQSAAIQVKTGKKGGRFIKVKEILDRWVDTGCWWDNESEKMFYRLCCDIGKIYEIFQDLENKQWFLYKTYD